MTTARRAGSGLEILVKSDALVAALEAGGELTVAQLAAATGEPVSTTYRLLGALGSIGWVDRTPVRGRYRLGLSFMRIGALVEDRLDVRTVAAPILAELRAATGATVFLCIRRGTSAVCIDRVEGADVRFLAMRLGDALPLHAGGAPRAILASLPRAEQEAVLDELGDDEGALRRILADDRQRGYSVSDGDLASGVGAIGVPILNHRGEVEASLAVSGLRDHVLGPETDLTSAVVAAGTEASRALGYEPDSPAPAQAPGDGRASGTQR